MKRTLYLLVAVCAAAALAGWLLARARASFRERDATEKAKLAVELEAQRPARYLADLIREADEIVISYTGVKDGREVRLNDSVWLSRLSRICGEALYTPTSHGLWISAPQIRLYRKKMQILDLMTFGAVLRVYSERESGDFIVGKDVTSAILELASEKKPNQSSEPTPTSGTSAAEQPLVPAAVVAHL